MTDDSAQAPSPSGQNDPISAAEAPRVYLSGKDNGGKRLCRVHSYLYQGDLQAACDHDLLAKHRIERVVSLLTPRRLGRLTLPSGMQRIVFRVQDNPSPEELPVWQEAIGTIMNIVRSDERVLVHCAAGRSRSQIAVILVVARLHGCPVPEAVAWINSPETIVGGWNRRLMKLLCDADEPGYVS